MGNTMKFLLDYYQYMDDIENLSETEDSKIYHEIEKRSKFGRLALVEGLIMTHPLIKSTDIIKRRFSELNTQIEEDGEIYIEGEFDRLKPIFK